MFPKSLQSPGVGKQCIHGHMMPLSFKMLVTVYGLIHMKTLLNVAYILVILPYILVIPQKCSAIENGVDPEQTAQQSYYTWYIHKKR